MAKKMWKGTAKQKQGPTKKLKAQLLVRPKENNDRLEEMGGRRGGARCGSAPALRMS
ncbi:hypothetical protein HaLaN_10921, partial [Haematococcus lacustris]